MKKSKNNLIRAERITQARKEMGLSQKELAAKIGVSDKAISSYEVGRVEPPAPVLKELSRVTYRPVTYFLDGVDAENAELQAKMQLIERELSEIRKILAKKKK